MCTSPKHIINRTKSYAEGMTKYSLTVPCGHCEDCRASRAEEWWQRIHQEFEDCMSAGGKVIFATLTYNDIHLPRFHYTDDDGNPRSFPCFSKHDKDRFVKSMRDYFRRTCKVKEKDCSYPFRYIWASEYGVDDNYTHRPHYHPLFFIPPEWIKAFGTDENDWKALLRRFWTDPSHSSLGFVRWNPENSIFVNSEFACIYTSKYICKDVGFYGNPDVDDYCKDIKISQYDKKYQAVKDYLPRHWQSLYFGANLEKIYGKIENYINGYNFDLNSERVKGSVVYHKCPMYIEKRMLYYKDSNGDDKLTEIGQKFKRDKFLYSINKNVDRLSRYSDVNFLNSRISDKDVQECDFLPFDTVQELADFIRHNADSHQKLQEYVLYNRVWSGLLVDDVKSLNWLSSLNHEDFVSFSIEQEVTRIFNTRVDLYVEEGVFLNFKNFNSRALYASSERFAGFTFLKQIYEWIDNTFRQRSLDRYLAERNALKRMKKELLRNVA